jgi:hypothetical protein
VSVMRFTMARTAITSRTRRQSSVSSDERTRQASLQPVKAGVIIFNPRNRRIVQIQNTYSERRAMAARVRRLERSGWSVFP